MFKVKRRTGDIPVNYFGVVLWVDKDCYFITTDKDGEVYQWDKKPTDALNSWEAHTPFCYSTKVCTIDFEGDWKESLLEIKEENIIKVV